MYNLYSRVTLFALKLKIKYIEKDPFMKGIVLKSRLYSFRVDTLTRHKYDGKHYSFHTYMVYLYAKKYIHLIPIEDRDDVLAAAFTHDLIEDCRETFNDVKKETNEKVARLTSALTTLVHGHNRAERAPRSYYVRILLENYADYLKLCDRLANTNISIIGNKGTMGLKYAMEYPHFKKALYHNEYDELYLELEGMYESIKNKNK